MKDMLFLAGRIPYPLDDGWKLRTFFLLRALSELGSSVDLLVFDETGQTAVPARLQALCRQVVIVPRKKTYSPIDLLKGLLGPVPFSVHNYTNDSFLREFRKLIAKHDYGYIQVEDIVMAQYVAKVSGVRKILDMHNIESDLLVRYAENTKNILKKVYALLTAKKLRQYEIDISENFDAVLVCSEEDKRILQQDRVRTHVEVIPNGVNADFYNSIGFSESEDDVLVFVGSMDYHANISGIQFFAVQVYPKLKERHKNLQVYVVGKNPPAEICALADENLIVTGAVDDVRPYLSRGVISFVPLLVGGGTRLKILEAMAAGLPVVSTSLGAEGLAVCHGHNILLADSADDFSRQITFLLEHPQERRTLADNGKQFVMEHYDWSVVTEKLQTTVRVLLDTPGEGA